MYFLKQIQCQVGPQYRGSPGIKIEAEVCNFGFCFFESEFLSVSVTDVRETMIIKWGLSPPV